MGEVLKEFDGGGEHMKKEGALLSSQEQAADTAGISEHQRKQAVRVANVPAAEERQARHRHGARRDGNEGSRDREKLSGKNWRKNLRGWGEDRIDL
jgi:hypothetical protein